MNRYITNDLSQSYLPPKPSFFEEKKMKDLKIGDYIQFKEFDVYEFRGTYLNQNMLFLSLQTEYQKNSSTYFYEPEKIMRVLNPPFKTGDYVKILTNFDMIITQINSIQAQDNQCFYYTCQSKGRSRPIHFTTQGGLNVELYRSRDEDALRSILTKLDSIEARLWKLESRIN